MKINSVWLKFYVKLAKKVRGTLLRKLRLDSTIVSAG